MIRMGQIHACSCFLEAVPRSAMVDAITAHAISEHHSNEGDAIRTDHAHNGYRFHIETNADRTRSYIRLS